MFSLLFLFSCGNYAGRRVTTGDWAARGLQLHQRQEVSWSNFLSPFSLSLLLHRNGKLLAEGYQPPQAVRTGTSIVGIIYADGVILGADTRATEGPIVSDKNCSKIHRLQDHIL